MKNNALIVNKRDNVAVALRDLKAGEIVIIHGEELFALVEDIPASHKLALREIEAEEEIVKYGEVVGVSVKKIVRGAWVHTHNLESRRWKK